MRDCPGCGVPMGATDRHCFVCGADVEMTAPAARAQPEDAASGREALLALGRRTFGGEPRLFDEGLSKLAAVAAWPTATGHVLVTMGLSTMGRALHAHELSGAGYEITWRIDGDISSWQVERLDELARFEAHGFPPPAGLLRPDPGLPPLDTVNGRVHFFELTQREEAPAWARLHAEALRRARPAVAFHRCTRPVGRSHFGGSARVPADFAWPARGAVPLPLLLEIELAEVPQNLAGLLPRDGRLLLFGVPDDRRPEHAPLVAGMRSWNEAFHAEIVTGLGEPRSEGARLPETPLGFVEFDDPATWADVTDGLDDAEDLEEEYEDFVEHRPELPGPHQLFGHLHPVQDDPVVEALLELRGQRPPIPSQQWEALRREARAWVPVLQLESDGDWSFASGGRLYLVAPRAEAAAGDLRNARVVIQR